MNKINRTLIIVPTYNERENISPLIEAIFAQQLPIEILVVDDNSPDGTGQAVQSLQNKFSNLHLHSRAGKEGLGKAYIAGFQWGLEKGFDALVEMDADFSHRPEDLKTLLHSLETADFAVGSRYVPGGGTKNWGWIRKIISRGGGIYSRFILGFPLNDWTGGFNAWRKETLRKIGLESVKSNGYSFQIELKYKALRAGCKGVEAPILFEDRRVGQSKMSSKIVLEALYRVWLLRVR
jgi:dolichol-phosphate mannosyltransferase